MPLEIVARQASGAASAFFAVKTMLGWTINESLGGMNSELSVSVNVIATPLEQQVDRLWVLEGAQISAISNPGKGPSVEDQRALSVMQKSIKNEKGHYSVAIPIPLERSLPNNQVIAERRLARLAKKMARNPTLKQVNTEGMRSLIQRGYAEVQYLPHHPVINLNKPKIRIVF